MSDFRERVVDEVINNNVPVSKYSAVERGEQRIHELEAKNADQSFRMREAAGLVEEVKADVIRLEARIERKDIKLAEYVRIIVAYEEEKQKWNDVMQVLKHQITR